VFLEERRKEEGKKKEPLKRFKIKVWMSESSNIG
jgi:hypothetical protein